MLNVGSGSIGDELMIILICHDMKWTYGEYMDQPGWFIDALNKKVNIENYHKNQQIKKSRRKNK